MMKPPSPEFPPSFLSLQPSSAERSLRDEVPRLVIRQDGPHTDFPNNDTARTHGQEVPWVEPAPLLEGESSPELPTAEDIFRHYAAQIFNLALRILGNEAEAEDTAQDALLQVVRKLDTFRGEAALSTWLYRITVNAAFARQRRRAVARERPLSEPLGQCLTDDGRPGLRTSRAEPPDQRALGQELNQLIERAVANLPPLYRETFILVDIEGVGNGEAARRLKLSLAALKSRLHRARLLMRQALAPHLGDRDIPRG
jgi:RNA polymerase sigma-70 factor, ECF subfamily